MTLLQKLKSLLGIADSGSQSRRDRDVGITVERERDESAGPADEAAGEPSPDEPTADAAVDEGNGESSDADETAESADADQTAASAAAETSASGSTGAMTETPDEPEEAAEPGEATGPSEADAAPTTEKTEEPGTDEPGTDEPGTDEPGTDESVDVIKGIGPAYADRLADAGVETVADLATSDAEELAEGTDISAKRIQGWIDRAEVR